VVRGKLLIALFIAGMLAGGGGCSLIVPTVAQRPVIRNPFPQLSRVAVAPFFNQSDEPTVDGRQVAMAYFAELQAVPGFEVVPLNVVEEAMLEHRIDLSGPNEARRLAKILGVDAVAVGSVTDFSEFYPPRIGLRVEWYAANPGYHEIPAGYGLPWDTPEEEFIPDALVYESQMALARKQMAAVTPDCDAESQLLPAPSPTPAAESTDAGAQPTASTDDAAAQQARRSRVRDSNVKLAQATEELPAGDDQQVRDASSARPAVGADAATTGATATIGAPAATPTPWLGTPCATVAAAAPPPCIPHYGPVLSHTRIYNGNDADVTEALEGYVFFRDDARFGGWKSFLNRTDDYIRFCCHMHISEMLSARGGSRKTQVVWQWPESR
jgi:hypothetical protein